MFDFNLDEVLTQPTTLRSESEENSNSFSDEDFSGLEFEDQEEEYIEEEINSALNPAPEQKTISKEDAQTGAEMAISLIDSVNQFGLSKLAQWKIKRRLGSKRVIQKMQLLFEKEIEGEEDLTTKEKTLLKRYNSYLRDKEEIPGIVSFSEEQKEKLTKSLAKYFYDKQIKFGGQDSFWAEFLLAEGMMIAQVLTM